MKSRKLISLIKITKFPSRIELIDDFNSFLSFNTPKEDYNIINKPNEILFVIKDQNLAYDFFKFVNKKITDNPLYINTECFLCFKKSKETYSTPSIIKYKKKTSNYTNVKSKLYLNKRNNIKLNHYFVNKGYSSISDYEKKHWANIKDKAGIIENDSPYVDNLSKEYREKKINEKKWVTKKNFNIFVGKATSINNSLSSEIKNYVIRTPSLPPITYKFRQEQRNKWVGGYFKLY